MKEKIKSLIVKLPLIRGFMFKWVKARFDIEELQKLNLFQQNQIKELQAAVLKMSETIRKEQLRSNFNHIKILQCEREAAYHQMLEHRPGMAQKETAAAEGVRYLKEAEPLVSIIILNHNGRDNLEKLMTSFLEKDFYRNFEIIFVDNASHDDSLVYMESWKNVFAVKIIRNEENMSFSAANNLGAERADGEYLLFLNNDIQVTDGWLDELLLAYHNLERPGAAGAKLVYPKVPQDTINAGKSYCIQHNGIAFRDVLREKEYFIQPYNAANGQADTEWDTKPVECACVTAAVLFVSKKVFNEAGGFDEKYIYGYEDVDFCLKLIKAGYKNYCCQSCLVYHYEFGTQDKDGRDEIRRRRLHNMDVLKGKWQSYLSRKILDDKLNRRHIFSEEKLVIAIAVTEACPETAAGDFFTAMELAESLEKMGFRIKYLSRRGEADWYDVGIDADVLIAMLDAYDIRKIYHAKNDLIKIAWARNWFDRWCRQEYFAQFDIVLASSTAACAYVDSHSRHQSILFPIASNHHRFYAMEKSSLAGIEEREKFCSDYAFTGSYWNAKRDIIEFLEPSEIPYVCGIYGANWEQMEKFREHSRGWVLYEDMPKVYQNTKIVIDDANYATKAYGAVNSRVFDALAAGTLVLTNGRKGADETFCGMLPSFESKEELNRLLLYYLENDEERKELAAELQKFVLENHTYDIRAEKLAEILLKYNEDHINEKEIDICGAMPGDESKRNWGDYHFALSMQKELHKMGFRANVLPKERWYDQSSAKYVIVLRGAKPYYPSMNDGRKFIMWNISHPQDVSVEEYNLYDYVFFASEKMKKEIGPQINVPSDVLLQCTDAEVMTYQEDGSKKYELLFVGNSRGVYRSILKALLPTQYRLSVYGEGWENFPVKEYVAGEHLENQKLGQAYHDAEIVLNDHWDDMREYGIISNRIFDVLAAGGFVISDYLPELQKVFGESVPAYRDAEDLDEKIRYYLENREEREILAKKGQRIVRSAHTFAVRMGRVHELLRGNKNYEAKD